MYENAPFTMSFVGKRLNEKHSKREERVCRPQGNNQAPHVSTIHVKDKHLVKRQVANVSWLASYLRIQLGLHISVRV